MSGQLRELKNRIRSVENTKKITRAMEMVAAAKLRRFQSFMVNAKPYTEGMERLVKRLQGQAAGGDERSSGKLGHPFFEKREEKQIALVLITSDTGLCGSYNIDLVSRARTFLESRTEEAAPILLGVGKSGIIALERQGLRFEQKFTDLRASRVEEILKEFKTTLEELYLSGRVDAIYVIYSHFKTLSTYESATEKLLPLEETGEEGESKKQAVDYIFEPDPETLFSRLVPVFFEAKTRMIFLEALVSEQIARMSAMHQATKNAKEMIDALVLQRNKVRQAMITKEIIEIVSGSQALKLK